MKTKNKKVVLALMATLLMATPVMQASRVTTVAKHVVKVWAVLRAMVVTARVIDAVCSYKTYKANYPFPAITRFEYAILKIAGQSDEEIFNFAPFLRELCAK